MENNKKILLISAIVIAVAILLVVFFVTPNIEFPYIETPNSENEVTDINYTENDQELFNNFLRDNISAISPEPEVLGGTFYVTDINWENEREGVVSYEDGHIAFEAMFGFSYPDANKDEVQLDYFEIIPVE